MQYLSKEENNKAYQLWLSEHERNKNLCPGDFIKKFNELFILLSTTSSEKNKYIETVDFKFGADRACFNRNETAILMCEMASPISFGITRNICVYDVKAKIAYNLRYGRGYKEVCNYIKNL